MKTNNSVTYLIQAYNDAIALKGLINELDGVGVSFVIHVDKKVDIKDFLIEKENVFYCEREFVSWAGYNQGKLIFDLLKTGLELKSDFYVFLSESDFPVYTKDILLEKLEQSKLIVLNCSKLQKNKIKKYWFYDFHIKSVNINKVLSKVLNFLSEIFYRLHIFMKKPYLIIDGKKNDVYFSSPFWALKYEEALYCYNVFERNKAIKRYFKHSFAPCELIIPTILFNSKYCNKCIERLEYINLNDLSYTHYFEYTGNRVNVLNEKSYENIINSKKPFIRKIKRGVSDELVDMIEGGKK